MPLRDHMDEILEARGFYRKHVAQERDAVYRAVADAVMDTQRLAPLLERAARLWKRGDDGRSWMKKRKGDNSRSPDYEDDSDDEFEQGEEGGCWRYKHREVAVLANVLNTSFHIIDTADANMAMLKIEPTEAEEQLFPEMLLPLPALQPATSPSGWETPAAPTAAAPRCGRKKMKKKRASSSVVFLCYSGDGQYDPVYPKSSIDAAGVIQSILYELLYVRVTGLTDAMEAAEMMLNGYSDPFHKPDLFNKEFRGTAMEALESNFIPFPYKVAKALDPDCYRNIEFDVWHNEARASGTSGSLISPGASPSQAPASSTRRRPFTITDLRPGHPILLRNIPGLPNEVYGFFMTALTNRRMIEVFIPGLEMCAYVPRAAINPIKNPPEELGKWVAGSSESSRCIFLRRGNEPELKYDLRTRQMTCLPARPTYDEDTANADAHNYSRRNDKAKRKTSNSSTPRRNNNQRGNRKASSNAGNPDDWVSKCDFSIPPPPLAGQSPESSKPQPPMAPFTHQPIGSGMIYSPPSFWPSGDFNPSAFCPPGTPLTPLPATPLLPATPTVMFGTGGGFFQCPMPQQMTPLPLQQPPQTVNSPLKESFAPATTDVATTTVASTSQQQQNTPVVTDGNNNYPMSPNMMQMVFGGFYPGPLQAGPDVTSEANQLASQMQGCTVTASAAPTTTTAALTLPPLQLPPAVGSPAELCFCQNPNSAGPTEPTFMVPIGTMPVTPFVGPQTPMTTPLPQSGMFQVPMTGGGPPTPAQVQQQQAHFQAQLNAGGVNPEDLIFQFPTVLPYGSA